MDNRQEILHQIQALLSKGNINFSWMDEEIDIELQTEFFKLLYDQPNDETGADIDELIAVLESDRFLEMKLDHQKLFLINLSRIDDVKAFRALERIVGSLEGALRSWAILAQHQSRVLMQSILSDETQVFISTGLGGKSGKLRYSIAIMEKNRNAFSEKAQQLISGEVKFFLDACRAELEYIRFQEDIVFLKALFEMDISLEAVFDDMLIQIKDLGIDIYETIIITNVKELNSDDVDEFFKKQSEKRLDNGAGAKD